MDYFYSSVCILAAGIMANESPRTVYDAELAVDLMMQIAEDISQRTAEPDRKYRQI